MTRKDLTWFVLLLFVQFGHSEEKHTVYKRSLWIRNSPTTDHRTGSTYHDGKLINRHLMTKLSNVLKETLIQFSKFNGQLAKYFVQHHPSLTNLYNKINDKLGKEQTTTTIRPIIVRDKGKWTDSSRKPLVVHLSEFQGRPPKTPADESIRAENISSGSLFASSVKSNIIRANSIVADNVVVSGNNGSQFEFQRRINVENEGQPRPMAFSFRNGQYGQNLFSNQNRFQTLKHSKQNFVPNTRDSVKSSQLGRRNYFPPRRNTNANTNNNFHAFPTRSNINKPIANMHNSRIIHNRDMSKGREFQNHNTFASILPVNARSFASIVPVNARSNEFPFPVQPKTIHLGSSSDKPQTQNRKKTNIPNSSSWADDWSDFDDSDDEEYYEYSESEPKRTASFPSVLSGSEIIADDIEAGSMYADSVKADTVNVRRIIADNVDVSARFGKK